MYAFDFSLTVDQSRVPAAIALLEKSLMDEGYPKPRPVLRMPLRHEEPYHHYFVNPSHA